MKASRKPTLTVQRMRISVRWNSAGIRRDTDDHLVEGLAEELDAVVMTDIEQ